MNEFELIKNYFQKLSFKSPSPLKLNDDVFFDKKNNLVVSIDTYVEGNHFLNFKYPDLVIKKVIRSSISDLVCKGVYPKYYFISASGNKRKFSKLNLVKINKSLSQEQKKFKIILSGGDTVNSNKISFTITTIGFAKKIVYRNKAKFNDDIYVTGNIGDSYLGLLVLKKKINLNKYLSNYFISKYYKPDLNFKIINLIHKFANTSIDVSDGIIADLDKLIKNQNFGYQVLLDKIPVSKNFLFLLKNNKILKKNYISKGDDYQILFTASKSKRNSISKIIEDYNVRITRIGKIMKNKINSTILDRNGSIIKLKNKGYLNKF